MKLKTVGRFDFLMLPRSFPFGQYQRTVILADRAGWAWKTKFAYTWWPAGGNGFHRLLLSGAGIRLPHDPFLRAREA